MASSALFFPVLYGKTLYMDGGYSNPCPIDSTLAKMYDDGREDDECDIYVVGSRTHPKHLPLLESAAFQVYVHTWLPLVSWSWSLTLTSRSLDDKIAEAAALYAVPEGVRICFIFPSKEDGILSIDARSWSVRKCGEAGYQSGMRLIETYAQ
jgi:hypothetical protein